MSRPRAPKGEAWNIFVSLAALETDECVEWPFAANQHDYGHVLRPDPRKIVVTHRTALERRVPSPSPGLDAAHGPCNNRRCMNYRHLRWATRKDNVADMKRDGTQPPHHGENNPNAKLTVEDVRELRCQAQAGVGQKTLAERYGITTTQVSTIVKRKAWKSVAA